MSAHHSTRLLACTHRKQHTTTLKLDAPHDEAVQLHTVPLHHMLQLANAIQLRLLHIQHSIR